jgi:hypothetical protein
MSPNGRFGGELEALASSTSKNVTIKFAYRGALGKRFILKECVHRMFSPFCVTVDPCLLMPSMHLADFTGLLMPFTTEETSANLKFIREVHLLVTLQRQSIV